MKKTKHKKKYDKGFSLIELLIVMTLVLVVLALVTTVFTASFSIRERETQKTDALTSVQAAINVMSREIGNSGFGLTNNGIVLDNSNEQKIHFRSNIKNDDLKTNAPGEEIIYYFDSEIDSVVRYDRFAVPTTSVVINRVSNITLQYHNFPEDNSAPTRTITPSKETGKIRLTVMVELEDVQGQPENQNVEMTTEIAIRNSKYMLNQY